MIFHFLQPGYQKRHEFSPASRKDYMKTCSRQAFFCNLIEHDFQIHKPYSNLHFLCKRCGG